MQGVYQCGLYDYRWLHQFVDSCRPAVDIPESGQAVQPPLSPMQQIWQWKIYFKFLYRCFGLVGQCFGVGVGTKILLDLTQQNKFQPNSAWPLVQHHWHIYWLLLPSYRLLKLKLELKLNQCLRSQKLEPTSLYSVDQI